MTKSDPDRQGLLGKGTVGIWEGIWVVNGTTIVVVGKKSSVGVPRVEPPVPSTPC